MTTAAAPSWDNAANASAITNIRISNLFYSVCKGGGTIHEMSLFKLRLDYPLLLALLLQACGDCHDLTVFLDVLDVSQFDSTAGWRQIISSTPIHNDERRWLATILVLHGCQLLLVAWMWTVFQKKQSTRPVKATFAMVVEFLPHWGLIRGTHSLYSLISRRRRATLCSFDAVFTMTIGLIQWRGVRTMRFLTLASSLIYLDSQALVTSLSLGNTIADISLVAKGVLRAAPTIIRWQVRARIEFAMASHLLFMATILPLGRRDMYCTFIILLPPLSAAILLQFLLTGHYISGPVLKPLEISLSSTNPSKGFCQICHDTVLSRQKPADISDQPTHHQTLKSLKTSAAEGCRICATVYYKLTRLKLKPPRCYIQPGPLTTYYRINGSIYINSLWSLGLCTFTSVRLSDASWGNLENHTGSESSLGMAKQWMSTCMRDHPSCSAGFDFHFRPSRLLYIGGDVHQVTLHTSIDYPETLSYMTLSHRWGEAQFIQLRHGNEETFRQGIPWISLPQTFKDAIRVARRLGSDYLWIDSLCIMQDSSKDWVAEAASMGNIYKNALCNIAASDALNSLEGCLYPRNSRVIEPERLPWDSDNSSNHLYLVNALSDDPDEHSRLYSRAWVFQEFLLARRTVDCGRDQLFWRCDELMASEEFPVGLTRDLKYHHFRDFSHPAREVLKHQANHASLKLMVEKMKRWEAEYQPWTRAYSGDSESQIHLFRREGSPSIFWTELVDQYSSMSITKEEDRLTAIAGVADTFRPFLGEYYAGMWKSLLPLYLVWRSWPRRLYQRVPSPYKRPSSKRGPTWSWISLEGPISHIFCSTTYRASMLAQLLDAKVLSAQDIHLRVRAPLIRLKWIDYATRGMKAWSSRSVNLGPRIKGSDGVSKWKSPWFESCVQTKKGGDAELSLIFDVPEEEAAARDIALVAIRLRKAEEKTTAPDRSPSWKGFQFDDVDGLILQDKGGGFFSRLGYFHTSECSDLPFLKCDQTEVVLI
ncbi:heterokaryon incompatibility protein-domain-containing protein [Colletotrichum navitas]|uniref:Heterokaryon incompatibility protein-domain-containing protein n=1 Tax=Colletotrichum navitas TaxID=681940 RepID=A0AAD8V1S8_9PEZI|nr:heterokaryon incompatibility protein-domain-containing protein [Colletotrichum navitas]KAK1574679.1 heterokaryon incompatibility protein-domain-containing protein [Colletotrichum navitas]